MKARLQIGVNYLRVDRFTSPKQATIACIVPLITAARTPAHGNPNCLRCRDDVETNANNFIKYAR